MQRSWDRRTKLAQTHSGTVFRDSPDKFVADFPNVKRADAFFDEMSSRGFVVDWDGTKIVVQRKEAEWR